MKKFFLMSFIILFGFGVFAQNNSITDVKITVTVPHYNESGILEEDVYEKAVPQDLNEAKRDIATILSVYNTTITSYNKHIDDLDEEIKTLLSELEKVTKESKKYQDTITNLTNKVDQAKENNNSITFLFPHFGISGGYGMSLKQGNHIIDLTADFYFSNFKISAGPLMFIDSTPGDNSSPVSFGFLANFGYIFK